MSKIGLVIHREYMNRVRKPAFVVLTILIPILMVGLLALAVWLGMEEKEEVRVLVSDPRNLCEGEIFVGTGENPPAEFFFYEDFVDSAMFRDRQEFEDYDVLIALSPNVITNKKIAATYREEPSNNAKSYIRSKLELRLEEYFASKEKIPLETYREIRRPTNFEWIAFDDTPENEGMEIRQGVGLGFSIFIFMFVLIYAAQVMRSVIDEKTSRVVEIVVSSIQPRKLMMGKIVAVGLVGLTQFLIWIILILALFFLLQGALFPDIGDPSTWQEVAPPGGNMVGEVANSADSLENRNEVLKWLYLINWPALIILFLVYFIGGYLLYGSLFAMIGSAVDSETDTQQLILPIMLPLIFSYWVSVMIIGNPDSSTAVVFSHIPFSSPIIMLQRVATGTVAFWEVIVSLLILIGTFLAMVWLAGKVYRVGILMYGKKVSWKEIIKWMRY